ncbi:MAG: aconitate hydratase B, partial [Gammaproteobacteria bacterium]|nr:aconitate hydratase B [Gammaproteobacteria bacterium]
MLDAYHKHVEERAAEGLPPLALDAEQTAALVELLKNPPKGQEQECLELFTHRVPPGVDQASYVKAGFLTAVAKGDVICPVIDPEHATELLGTMLGGYNIQPLIDLLDDDKLGSIAADALSTTLLMFDAYHDVIDKAKSNQHAQRVV